jgi:hypothetical protein
MVASEVKISDTFMGLRTVKCRVNGAFCSARQASYLLKQGERTEAFVAVQESERSLVFVVQIGALHDLVVIAATAEEDQ